MHKVEAEVIRWIDGDTVVVAADVWPDIVAYAHIRLPGYDAPETGKPGAARAKERALELAPVGSTVVIELSGAKDLHPGSSKHPRSFIRFIGHVWRAGVHIHDTEDHATISEILTDEHLTKADWAQA